MPHIRLRLSKQGIRWALLAALLLLLVSGGFVILVPYWRQHAAIADLQAVAVPPPHVSFEVVRQDYDAPPQFDAVTLVPGGPEWLRNIAGDRVMFVFDRVERIAISEVESANTVARHLPRFVHLRSLYLLDFELTDSGLESVSRCSRLEELHLDGSGQFTDDGLRHLTRLQGLKHLMIPSINDADIVHLETLSQLEALHLDASLVTDAGLSTIGKFNNLRHLIIGGRGITDVGLANIERLSKLEGLGLENTSISDEGLKSLSRLSKLRKVHIWNAAVTDAGLLYLSLLPDLELIRIARTNVTQSGIDELKRRHPRLEVVSPEPLKDTGQ